MRKHEEIGAAFSHRDSLDGKTSFFLVGIGGAGMSALARMLKHRGYRVRGTDSTPSIEVERLTSEGIEVHIGHTGDFIEPGDALILTDAIDLAVSPEFAKGRDLGLPIVRRSQALGWMLKGRNVIAVTGTHGKTTTTGMLGNGLAEGGFDPLVVVGANIAQFGGPVREGDGEFAVVEACEAYDSFHDLDPFIVLLTNLELDHIDFHGSYENLRASVCRFVAKIPVDGCLVYCAEDPGATEVAAKAACRTVPYQLSDYGRIMETHPEILMGSPHQKGRHNAVNSAGALVAAEQIGATSKAVFFGVSMFKGAERRQQVLLGGDVAVFIEDAAFASPARRRIVVVDDYAHHPTEVKESLSAILAGFLLRVPNENLKKHHGTEQRLPRRLIVVFQPHLYSRTAALLNEFAEALSVADEIVITDIYPAREDPMPGISSARIAEKIRKPVHYIPSRHLLPMYVAEMLELGDVVVGMGAGNISEFAPALIHELDRKYDLMSKGGLIPNGRPLKISVLYGGESAEREVSIHSGRAVHAALKRLGHDSKLVDMTEKLFKGADLSDFIGPDRPDLAFLAVHGTHAEDGAIQGLLELLHIPYTGSGIQASAIAMDKALTKQILQQHGVRVPKGALLAEPDPPFDLQPPLIVKPNAQGSTVGLSFVENQNQLCPALLNAFQYDKEVLVEEWIKGMEISTPVLDDEALLPVEIAPATGKYDFESKYTPGATNEIVPARLPKHLLEESQRIALKAHRALRCAGATRTDMIVRDDEIFVLEINTLPGMTSTSLLPNSAAAAGISFDQLCQRLVEDALKRHAKKAQA